MVVTEINRTSKSHGDYYGNVRLTYDEITMINNALYQKMKNTEDERYTTLYNNWSNFKDMTSYGSIIKR